MNCLSSTYRMLTLLPVLLVAGTTLAGSCHAQITLTNPTQQYTQNFDTLKPTSGTGTTFQNNPSADGTNGLAGWYARNSTGAAPGFVQGTGSGTTGSLYSYGSTTSPTDRALGSLASSNASTSLLEYGANIVNNTGSDITSFTISYDGEQWRSGGTQGGSGSSGPNSLYFFYSTTATDIGNDTYKSALADNSYANLASGVNLDSRYIHVSGLDFNSPNVTTAGALDGNASANRTPNITYTINDTIPNGQNLWIHWIDPNDNNSDHGLAVDNLSIKISSFSATSPAPTGVVSAGIGFGVTGVSALLRRRKQAKATKTAEATA